MNRRVNTQLQCSQMLARQGLCRASCKQKMGLDHSGQFKKRLRGEDDVEKNLKGKVWACQVDMDRRKVYGIPRDATSKHRGSICTWGTTSHRSSCRVCLVQEQRSGKWDWRENKVQIMRMPKVYKRYSAGYGRHWSTDVATHC